MAGRRVLLVDADLRRPQLHQMFKIPKSPGLSDLLMGGVTPSEALIESSVPGLFLLTAGTDVASPSDALDSQRLTQLIEGFDEDFDLVVLDCPPVLPVADATIIANAATSVLFVVGSGTTSRSDAAGGHRPARLGAGASGWRRAQQSPARFRIRLPLSTFLDRTHSIDDPRPFADRPQLTRTGKECWHVTE